MQTISAQVTLSYKCKAGLGNVALIQKHKTKIKRPSASIQASKERSRELGIQTNRHLRVKT